MHAVKYEALTITLDGRYVIATTGFDRVKERSPEWNSYNTLLIWPTERPEDVHVVEPTTINGITSSVSLRRNFARVLTTDEFPDGMPYFKIEGISVVPGNKLLIGIREMGATYMDFRYVIKIVSVSYHITTDGQLQLQKDFKLIYDYDCIYILTSFEDLNPKKILGGYLWLLSMNDLRNQNPPTLVMEKGKNHPLIFDHKAEGIAVLDDSTRLFIVNDNDRVLQNGTSGSPGEIPYRKPFQAPYVIVNRIVEAEANTYHE
jgi:hypothetical protein